MPSYSKGQRRLGRGQIMHMLTFSAEHLQQQHCDYKGRMSIIIKEGPTWDNKFHSGLGSYFYMFSSDKNNGRITHPWFRTIQSSSGVCINRKSRLSKTLTLNNIIPLAHWKKFYKRPEYLENTLRLSIQRYRLTGNGCLGFFPKYFHFQCHFLRTTIPTVFSYICKYDADPWKLNKGFF